MTCRELVEFLMAYLDGELRPDEQASFEAHLQACPPCGVYLDTYRETVRLGRKVCGDDCDDLPQDVPEDLVRAILTSRRP